MFNSTLCKKDRRFAIVSSVRFAPRVKLFDKKDSSACEPSDFIVRTVYNSNYNCRVND